MAHMMSNFEEMSVNLADQKRRASAPKSGKRTGRQAQVSLFGIGRCETVDRHSNTLGTLSDRQMERDTMRKAGESGNSSRNYEVVRDGNSIAHNHTSASYGTNTNIATRSVNNNDFDISSDPKSHHYRSFQTLYPLEPTEIPMNGMMQASVTPDQIYHYQQQHNSQPHFNESNSVATNGIMTKSETNTSFNTSKVIQSDNSSILSPSRAFKDSEYSTNDMNDQDQSQASQYSKPDTTYAAIITEAFNSHQNKLLTLNEIYTTIIERYPYFKTAPPGWKNSIRHNLSLHKAFARVVRPTHIPGKGSFWKLATGGPEEVPKKQTSGHSRRSVSESLVRHGSVSSGSRPSFHEQQYTFNFSPRPTTDQSVMHQLSVGNAPNVQYTNMQPNFVQGHPVYILSPETPHSNITRRRAFSMNPYSESQESEPFRSYDFPTEDNSQASYVQSIVPQMIMNAPIPFYSNNPILYDPFAHAYHHQSNDDPSQNSETNYSQTSHTPYSMIQDSNSSIHWDPLRAIHQTHLNHRMVKPIRRSSIPQSTEHPESPRISDWSDTANSPRRNSGSESPYGIISSPSTPRKSSLSTVSALDSQVHMAEHSPGCLITPDNSPLPPHMRESDHIHSNYQTNTLITPVHSPMTNIQISQLQVPLFQQDPTVPAMETVPSTDDLEVLVSNNKYYNQNSFYMNRPRGMSITGMIPSSPLKNTVPVSFDKHIDINDTRSIQNLSASHSVSLRTSVPSDSGNDVQMFGVPTAIGVEMNEEQSDWAFM